MFTIFTLCKLGPTGAASRSTVPPISLLLMPSNDFVVAVALSPIHTGLHKERKPSITLVAGHGVEGDCHAGKPGRQVSLLQSESLNELNDMNSGDNPISPSELGENITTSGLNLADLKQGTELHFIGGNEDGNPAVVAIKGLRRAGPKLETRREGLTEQCTVRDASGAVVGSKVGVLGVVRNAGMVKPGMSIFVMKPTGDLKPLEFV